MIFVLLLLAAVCVIMLVIGAIEILIQIFPAIVAGVIVFAVVRWWTTWRWNSPVLGEHHWKYDHCKERWRKLYFVFENDDIYYWYDWKTRSLVPQAKYTKTFRWWDETELSWEVALHVEGLTACGLKWVRDWKEHIARISPDVEPERNNVEYFSDFFS